MSAISRRWLLLFLCGALGLALAACKPSQPAPASASSETTSKPPPTRLGLLLPLTGAQQAFGQEALAGAELAVRQINASGGILNRPLELLVRDTGSESAPIAQIIAEMAREPNLPIALGEVTSSRTLEAARQAQAAALPLIAPSATHPEITSAGLFIFRTCFSDPRQGEAMALFAASLKASRAAILCDPSDPYSQALAGSFRKAFLAAEGNLTADLALPPEGKELPSILRTVAQSQPDIIFLPLYFQDAAHIIRQARQEEISLPFLGGDAWDAPDFFELGGQAVENCYVSSHFSAGKPEAAVETFARDFSEAFGRKPAALAALFYDAVKVAAAAVASAGSLHREEVRDALTRTAQFPGVTGTITFDESRNCPKPVEILRVQDGAFTYLETIPAR